MTSTGGSLVSRWMPAPGRARRKAVVRLIVVLAIVLALLGLHAGWAWYRERPIRHGLLTGAAHIQERALTARSEAPASTGPAAERALAEAVRAVDRVQVLGTSTATDGSVRVDVSLWDEVEDYEFSLTYPKEAQVCLRVVAVPGMTNGGYGTRGTVAVHPFDCPPGVELAKGVRDLEVPARMPELQVDLPAALVPPEYKPCYSGSNTCN